MHFAGFQGGLEVRNEGGVARLAGRFPYSVETELAPGRRERIAPGAFAESAAAGGDILLLAHHDFEKPIASTEAGTLHLRSDYDALSLEATIAPDLAETTHVKDLLGTLRAGLVGGISPGFRLRPGGERIARRGDTIVRAVLNADLIEISAVTRPAYPQSQIEARSWSPHDEIAMPKRAAALRWRA